MPDTRSRSRRYNSEYKSHYKVFASRRPHTTKGQITRSVIPYELESHISTPRAGLQSTQLGIIHEPPLQRKKIVPYEKNHNIFPTGTVKELTENEWLRVEESARQKPNTPKPSKSPSKSKINTQERHESPILLAEKKLHMSSPGKITGYNYVPDGLKRSSTYTQDFGSKGRKSKERSHKQKSPAQKSKPVIGKTKSGVSPDRLPPAGIPTMTCLGDKRLLKPSDNSQYMKSPDQARVYDSEYSSRFKFINGTWIESPEFQGRPSPVDPMKSRMDWYKEAISRRNEAYGYAHRQRGTHFSCKELDRQNRLNAINNEDIKSVSEVSNHSTSHPSKKNEREKKRNGKNRKEKYVAERPPIKKEAWVDRPASPNESSHSFSTSYTDQTATENGQFILERGRSPTPELRETGQSRRHHYDMTTNILNEKLEKSLTFSPEHQPMRSKDQNGFERRGSLSTSIRSQDGSYIPPKNKRQPDDVMSEVSMSSRATTASETLERAKNRRDHFWAQNKKLEIEN